MVLCRYLIRKGVLCGHSVVLVTSQANLRTFRACTLIAKVISTFVIGKLTESKCSKDNISSCNELSVVFDMIYISSFNLFVWLTLSWIELYSCASYDEILYWLFMLECCLYNPIFGMFGVAPNLLWYWMISVCVYVIVGVLTTQPVCTCSKARRGNFGSYFGTVFLVGHIIAHARSNHPPYLVTHAWSYLPVFFLPFLFQLSVPQLAGAWLSSVCFWPLSLIEQYQFIEWH